MGISEHFTVENRTSKGGAKKKASNLLGEAAEMIQKTTETLSVDDMLVVNVIGEDVDKKDLKQMSKGDLVNMCIIMGKTLGKLNKKVNKIDSAVKEDREEFLKQLENWKTAYI